MRRLLLVRHGESVWNAAGRIQGQQCAGLSERGLSQAALVGQALGEAHADARVVVSDLLRCQQTARPLLEALGADADAASDPGLRERSFGDWEGLTPAEVERRDPDRWSRWRTAGGKALGEVGGETDEAFVARIEPVLRRLLATTPGGGVTVAVSHGGTIWHGTHALLGLPTGTLGPVDNASVTELLSWDGERVLLGRWNEVAHLPLELRLGWRPSAVA